MTSVRCIRQAYNHANVSVRPPDTLALTTWKDHKAKTSKDYNSRYVCGAGVRKSRCHYGYSRRDLKWSLDVAPILDCQRIVQTVN